MAKVPLISFWLLMGLSLPSAGLSVQVAAQEPPSSRLQGISKGASLDRFIYDGTGETALSFRLTRLGRGMHGPDIGLSLFPGALAEQALVWATDFGGAYQLQLPNVTLLLKAGGSALTGLAADLLFVPGAHVGGGLIVRLDTHTGIRLDAIRHFYFEEGETEPIWSVGLGFCSLPRTGPKSTETTR